MVNVPASPIPPLPLLPQPPPIIKAASANIAHTGIPDHRQTRPEDSPHSRWSIDPDSGFQTIRVDPNPDTGVR